MWEDRERHKPSRLGLITKVLGESFLGFETVFEFGKHQLAMPGKQLMIYDELPKGANGNPEILTGQLV